MSFVIPESIGLQDCIFTYFCVGAHSDRVRHGIGDSPETEIAILADIHIPEDRGIGSYKSRGGNLRVLVIQGQNITMPIKILHVRDIAL